LETGHIANTEYGNFKKGAVTDPLDRIIFNKGYMGVGKYKMSIDGKSTKCYRTWYNMFTRCYNINAINKWPTYAESTVCKEWHNFQVFAQWYNDNFYQVPDEQMHLDKDLTKHKNKCYCPKFCSFVPSKINVLLTKRDRCRGDYPIGVTFNKHYQMYSSRLSVDGKKKTLGYFNTPEEAFYCYKEAKERYIKVMANRYIKWIPAEVYDYLMSYEVKITD